MRGDHVSQNAEDVLVDGLLHVLRDVTFGVDLSGILDRQFLSVLFSLLLDPLRPLLAPLAHLLQVIPAALGGLLLILEFERVVPLVFIEVQQHLLLEFIGAVVDIDRVVVFVEALVHCLDRGLVEVPADGGRLSGLVAAHAHEWVDESEGVDHYLSAYGLDGVDDYCDALGVELLEGLLSGPMST